jgi:hypothetical protein
MVVECVRSALISIKRLLSRVPWRPSQSPREQRQSLYTDCAQRCSLSCDAALLQHAHVCAGRRASSCAPRAGTSDLKAFAVRAPEVTLRVCLINQNITRDKRVAIDSRQKFTVASMLRLAGPAIDATAGVTLGGASVDEIGRYGDGAITPAILVLSALEGLDIVTSTFHPMGQQRIKSGCAFGGW